MKFYIHTFGCQMNENDSNSMTKMLISHGFSCIDQPEQADVIIVNTCCIRKTAEDRALGYLGSLKKLHDQNPDLIIVVCGCMMQKYANYKLIQKSYRHIAIIAGTFSIAKLIGHIESYRQTRQRIIDITEHYEEDLLEKVDYVSGQNESWRAQINITYGCNNFCSYCIVPYVRGHERSRAPGDIVAEVKTFVDRGIKEVQLLGQNVNSYGKDFKEPFHFVDLLSELNTIDGLFRIRYMTSHPRDFDKSLVEQIGKLDKVCHHFHLPIQSGSTRILELMNRGYSVSHYLQLIDTIRACIPDAAITTDIIVGFPSESEADFSQTMKLVEKCRFDAIYTFLYSKREGTPAALIADQIPDSLKKERLNQLMQLQNEISLENNLRAVGSYEKIIIEGISKNNSQNLFGRTDGNKVVIVPRNDDLKIGDIVDVKITSAQTWNLFGEVVLP